MVAEIMSRKKVSQESRSWHCWHLHGGRGRILTSEYRRRIRPVGGRTGAARLSLRVPRGGLFPEAPPGEGRAQAVDQVPREASSLKLLREKVNPQKSSQDSRCGNPTQR